MNALTTNLLFVLIIVVSKNEYHSCSRVSGVIRFIIVREKSFYTQFFKPLTIIKIELNYKQPQFCPHKQ